MGVTAAGDDAPILLGMQSGLPEVAERRWFWTTLVLSSTSIIAVVFAFWELVENSLFRDANYVTLHYLYVSRGIASSLLMAMWAAWYVLRQRRSSEQQLRRSHERYRGLLDASPSAVALFDRDLNVLEWNASAQRLYGYSREEVLRRPLPMVPAVQLAELHGLMQRVDAGEAILSRETQRTDAAGRIRFVELNLLPFEEHGERLYLEASTDVSERRRLRDTLVEVEKLTVMGTMAAGTAHHLNTPLASMLLRVEMMREQASGSPLQADLERLQGSLSFCQQFVRTMLDFSRRPAVHRQPENVTALAEAVVCFLQPSFHARNVQLRVEADAAALAVDADRNQIETLLVALLANALDASASGSQVVVRTRREADSALVEVADQGCGIPADQLERVFEPFFTTKPPGKGTGLGLALACTIAAEHGGKLRLQSEVGRGTRAILELPLHSPAPATSPEVTACA